MFWNEFPYTDFHELNLDWVLVQTKRVIDAVTSIDGWIEEHQKEYEELKELYDKIMAGELPAATYTKLELWLRNNLFDIVGSMIKFITVYITDDGYIAIKYPEQWSSLIFNTTGLDINTPLQPEYGHLTLSY